MIFVAVYVCPSVLMSVCMSISLFLSVLPRIPLTVYSGSVSNPVARFEPELPAVCDHAVITMFYVLTDRYSGGFCGVFKRCVFCFVFCAIFCPNFVKSVCCRRGLVCLQSCILLLYEYYKIYSSKYVQLIIYISIHIQYSCGIHLTFGTFSVSSDRLF